MNEAKKIYPYDRKDQMGVELWSKIKNHPQEGHWKEGIVATGLMLNSAGHPDGNQAMQMVIEDIVRAHERGAPTEIITFALNQVVEYRKLILEAQGRDDGEIVVGDISLETLSNKLEGKIPTDIHKTLFPEI